MPIKVYSRWQINKTMTNKLCQTHCIIGFSISLLIHIQAIIPRKEQRNEDIDGSVNKNLAIILTITIDCDSQLLQYKFSSYLKYEDVLPHRQSKKQENPA